MESMLVEVHREIINMKKQFTSFIKKEKINNGTKGRNQEEIDNWKMDPIS